MEAVSDLLNSGMFALVALALTGGRKAIYVPKDAVVRRDKTAAVFVVAVGGLVEIMDGALTSGQEGVVSGNDALRVASRCGRSPPNPPDSSRAADES